MVELDEVAIVTKIKMGPSQVLSPIQFRMKFWPFAV